MKDISFAFVHILIFVLVVQMSLKYMDEEITHVHQYSEERVREAPLKKLQGLFGHCQNGEGGLNACQDGLGHPYIWVKMREEVPQSARLSEGGGIPDICP